MEKAQEVDMVKKHKNLDIVVFGASGNLAKGKIFPALFALFSQGLLPEGVRFLGFARSRMTQTEFKEKIMLNLTCRYTPDHSCGDFIEKFIECCHYCNGEYDSLESFLNLSGYLRTGSNRILYLALPPEIFPTVSQNIDAAGMLNTDDDSWARVVVEKPFGHDRQSSDELNNELLKVFSEKQIYRIDHYLGKEMIQNILVLRFANQIFKPLWNSTYIRCVRIDWQENIGTEGRGGYFDNYGIIRDVIQNHMLQLIALIAMEEPESLHADAIRDCKVKVFNDIDNVSIEDAVLGQYDSYTEDPMVPNDSITPTFANVRLRINNEKWQDIPFVIRAGKGLARKINEIRIVFRHPKGNIFCDVAECPPPNELIIRIQPDEGIHFNIVSKVPGSKMKFQPKELDLSYKSAFADTVIPEAYESLLLDVINGEKSLFIRSDELETTWDIFTPLLHNIDSNKIKPKSYIFGSEGPDEPCTMECEKCVYNRK